MPKWVIFACLALAGCSGTEATTQKTEPSAPMSQQEWCRKAMQLLGGRYISDHQKEALLEMARNRGCLGQSQPPTQ